MRRATREELTGTLFDLVVVGGGVTGVATAREAALRGLSVALVEKDDFAAGTSSRSSKLVHGGLRYLQTYQFRLVAESVRERERTLRIAPHLTELRPFLYLLYDGYPEGKALLNLGLTFYDAVSGQWRSRRHRMLNAEQVLRREPHLARAGLKGAGLYYDALTDDARLTLATAKGAADAGALLVNHAAVTALVLENGTARGVTVTDTLTGESYDIHARQVLNATGPWTDRTRALEHTAPTHRLRPTKGVHIVLRKSDFPLNTAVFLRSPDDNRVVWPTPSLEDDVVYIGTTDTDYDGDPDDVRPDEQDIRYLLNVANHTIPEARLTTDHVVGSWAGLRPLVAPPAGVSESNTSREHEITAGPTGMLTISGGKLTSNVLMARQFVDAAQKASGTRPGRFAAGKVPVAGGDRGAARTVRAEAERAGVPGPLAEQWLRRYGSDARAVLTLWREDEAAREVIGARNLTRAELRHLVRHEMARTLEDLLVRRTSVFFWDATGGLDTVDAVAAELARELDWTPERTATEIATYRHLVTTHRPPGAA
ncbi:glycerol-3-phosphate dehydrogenase/oxidase [Streptomyces sp. NPDC049881]|uniref:glycerol-3-phosphate dehydrogenase/oxidase n=1 Tax=Streptomyces sp. NPDC049881 TaxID=3155778 RepID=UPI003444D9A1